MLFKNVKKSSVLQLAGMLIIAAFAMSFLACDFEPDPGIEPIGDPIDPSVEDYLILVDGTLLSEDLVIVYDGKEKKVDVQRKLGASPGDVTVNVLYVPAEDDLEPIPGIPVEQVGTYHITIDVEEADGWNPAWSLEPSGNIIINDGNPTALLFDYDEFEQVFGNVNPPKITAKQGGPTGAITIRYWTKTDPLADSWDDNSLVSTRLPTAVGEYKVDFNVAAAPPYSAATGLEAPYLFVIRANDPEAKDYDFGDDFVQTYTGSGLGVEITGTVPGVGAVTATYYEGTEGTVYAKSDSKPTNAGKYIVTFDVEANGGFNKADGLTATKQFVIEKATPTLTGDYRIVKDAGTYTYLDGLPREVIVESVTPGVGEPAVFYAGDKPVPTLPRIYKVTVVVEATDNYNGFTTEELGNLIINKATPVLDDFTVDPVLPVTYKTDSIPVTPVTITAATANVGAASVPGYTLNGNPAELLAVGTYTVSFSFGSTAYYNEGTLVAGEIVIESAAPPNPNDSSLISLTINGALADIPAGIPGNDVQNSNTTITMTTAQYNNGRELKFVAIPTNPDAVISYFIGSSNGTMNWVTGGTNYTWTGTFNNARDDSVTTSGNRIFVRVVAGTSTSVYRMQRIIVQEGPVLSKVNTISSLKINGVSVTPIPDVNTAIPTSSARATISMSSALYNNGANLKIEATPTDTDGAKIVGYAMASQITTFTDDEWMAANFTYGKYDAGGIIGEYTLPGTHDNSSNTTGSRIYVWVKAEDTTVNGYYRIQITINN
jgi:hypothetical protein